MINDQIINIYTDGGSRGNPGPAACAFLVYDSTDLLIYQQGIYLGAATNNQAEYHAVLSALKYLSTCNYQLSIINFYLDSQLVVRQLSGVYKIKDPALQSLAKDIKKLISNLQLAICNFNYIPREENSSADLLVNQTLDRSLKS